MHGRLWVERIRLIKMSGKPGIRDTDPQSTSNAPRTESTISPGHTLLEGNRLVLGGITVMNKLMQGACAGGFEVTRFGA